MFLQSAQPPSIPAFLLNIYQYWHMNIYPPFAFCFPGNLDYTSLLLDNWSRPETGWGWTMGLCSAALCLSLFATLLNWIPIQVQRALSMNMDNSPGAIPKQTVLINMRSSRDVRKTENHVRSFDDEISPCLRTTDRIYFFFFFILSHTHFLLLVREDHSVFDFLQSPASCFPTNWSVDLIWHPFVDKKCTSCSSGKASKDATQKDATLNKTSDREQAMRNTWENVDENTFFILYPDPRIGGCAHGHL